MAAMQGPHHVAQNSTTYTLPDSNDLTGEPATHVETTRGGAESPTERPIFSSAGGFGFSWAPPHAARARQQAAASKVRISNTPTGTGAGRRPEDRHDIPGIGPRANTESLSPSLDRGEILGHFRVGEENFGEDAQNQIDDVDVDNQ